MIRYRLQCKKKHEFESWFGSSDAFDKLAAGKQVQCPQCGSKSIEKSIMAPGVVKSAGKSASKRRSQAKSAPEPTLPAPSAAPSVPEVVQKMATHPELHDAIRKLRAEVEAKSEYVGRRFSEEARKIHHEETPARGIYGEATMDEARALLEEGIEFLPLPTLPEDHN